MKHTAQPTFFPGNNLLLEKTEITTTRNDAAEIQLQVGSDLTTMRTFSFNLWRSIIASRYAADPLVMELLTKYEHLHNSNQEENKIKRTENFSLSDEPQPWQSIFS